MLNMEPQSQSNSGQTTRSKKSMPPGVKGSELLRFMGRLKSEDVEQMARTLNIHHWRDCPKDNDANE